MNASPRSLLHALLTMAALSVSVQALAQTPADTLRPASDFASIADEAQRSQALYAEMSKVIRHPRCMNCHPSGHSPTQGEDMHPHLPMVTRGPDNHGATAMQCSTCHQFANFEASGVPGHPLWHLAPLEMAWQGKTDAEICAQLKDPERNGGKDLAALHEHMALDSLVGWGWRPGGDREPAPGTQQMFGELTQAWIDSGAVCPEG